MNNLTLVLHQINTPKIRNLAFWGILVFGIFCRVAYFWSVPAGLAPDEASNIYEAWSIWSTGNDRWGNHLPPYMMAWGSGQNVFVPYISAPFVGLLGPVPLAVRIPVVIFGTLCLWLVYQISLYFSCRKWVAQLATLLFVFDPFYTMLFRWGNDFNITPFFVLLTVWLSIKSTEKNSTWSIVFLGISFALLIYNQAIGIFIVPLFLIFYIPINWQNIKFKKWYFMAAALAGFIVILPFLLFFLKNNIFKSPLAIEPYLPFDITQLLSDREHLPGARDFHKVWNHNARFIFSGFLDYWNYNSTDFRTPHLAVWLWVPGVIYLFFNFKNQLSVPSKLLASWILVSFVPFLLFNVNLNRTPHIQALVPILVALGLYFVLGQMINKNVRYALAIGFIVVVSAQAVTFLDEYYFNYRRQNVWPTQVDKAIAKAIKNKKPNEKIALSHKLIFSYLFAGIYDKIEPNFFQKNVVKNMETGNVIVYEVGDYMFLGDVSNKSIINQNVVDSLAKKESFIAILSPGEGMEFFPQMHKKMIGEDNLAWQVVRYEQVKK